jgi:adenine-specific DNA methylase
MTCPKRLIEVDLPIKRISAHARREKSIRHGHISTLHIWWARRPLAACRAVICAALWPDPADEHCPAAFRKAAERIMLDFARKVTGDTKLANDHCSPENFKLWQKLSSTSAFSLQPLALRQALLDFIADFANWDNSTVREYLDTARLLTAYAHRTLTEPGFKPTTAEIEESIRNPQSAIRNWAKPLVVDPFCGGGSIPLEALRVGADAFASDLNPIPVLLNKVVLEYIPKYGQRLADEVRKWGEWIKKEAEKELAEFYPKDPDGATPIAYLWARTIQCEGPGCGAEVPLIRSLWLAKKANRSVALQLVPRPRAKRVDFQIIVKQRGGWVDQDDPKTKIAAPKFDGTVKGGSATCPCCGYTTQVARVREQLRARRGGADDARLMCVVTTRIGQVGRSYRPPTPRDDEAARNAGRALKKLSQSKAGQMAMVPDEPLPQKGTLGFRVQNYGVLHWSDIYTPRQALTLATIAGLVKKGGQLAQKQGGADLGAVVQAILGLSLNRLIGRVNALCWWRPQADQEKIEVAFSGQTVPMKWDFAEGCPLTSGTAGWDDSYAPPVRAIEALAPMGLAGGTVAQISATEHPLPDDAAHVFLTDPPYYDAVPYAALSDFFYVWLKRTMPSGLAASFSPSLTPKDGECIVDEVSGKDRSYFERCMAKAMAEGRRVLAPEGIGVIVFAHKSTSGWESQLQAMVDAGWTVTGSWPIDTEMGTRLRARDSAALASSVHIVCRPRENPDGSVRTDEVGDWRDVLAELPRRIHDWMPRLAVEGVVGADAIFACLGPALEIFSRYSRVEKASGEAVTLGEYLVQVWAAVAKEALTMIFTDADATGFEEDARLTAMWLWTLNTNAKGETLKAEVEDGSEGEDDEGGKDLSLQPSAFSLEFDAARKIAQGLGAHLEDLASLVAVEGETARLLPVAERANHLFGKDEGKAAPIRRKRGPQMELFKPAQDTTQAEATFGETKIEKVGATVLDRVHQSMILFAAGRSEALKRFLVEDGAGNNTRFWTLAQALSALYPASTDEKRWVDGVLARKKGLGF